MTYPEALGWGHQGRLTPPTLGKVYKLLLHFFLKTGHLQLCYSNSDSRGLTLAGVGGMMGWVQYCQGWCEGYGEEREI